MRAPRPPHPALRLPPADPAPSPPPSAPRGTFAEAIPRLHAAIGGAAVILVRYCDPQASGLSHTWSMSVQGGGAMYEATVAGESEHAVLAAYFERVARQLRQEAKRRAALLALALTCGVDPDADAASDAVVEPDAAPAMRLEPSPA